MIYSVVRETVAMSSANECKVHWPL